VPSQLGNSRGIGLNAAIGNLAAAAVRPALGGTPETYLHGVAADGTRLYAPSGYGCVPIALAILSGISIVGGVPRIAVLVISHHTSDNRNSAGSIAIIAGFGSGVQHGYVLNSCDSLFCWSGSGLDCRPKSMAVATRRQMPAMIANDAAEPAVATNGW
jgi:hypothetical protein